jgi:hypothetical protein
MGNYNNMTSRINMEHLSSGALLYEFQRAMESKTAQFEKFQTVIEYTRKLIFETILEKPTEKILVEAFEALCNQTGEIKPGLDYTRGVVMKLPQNVAASLVDREGTTSILLRAGRNEWKVGYDQVDGVFNYCK